MNLIIRPFHYTDLDGLIEIAAVAFAQAYAAQGGTPEEFAREIRPAARRPEIAAQLTAADWQKQETWLRFVKRL